MTLKITHEPADTPCSGVMENCCMCRTPTRWWHASDVALCPGCAKTTKLADLPTKKEWCDKERAAGRGNR